MRVPLIPQFTLSDWTFLAEKMEEATWTSSENAMGYFGEKPLDQLSGALLESAVPLVVFRIVPL